MVLIHASMLALLLSFSRFVRIQVLQLPPLLSLLLLLLEVVGVTCYANSLADLVLFYVFILGLYLDLQLGLEAGWSSRRLLQSSSGEMKVP